MNFKIIESLKKYFDKLNDINMLIVKISAVDVMNKKYNIFKSGDVEKIIEYIPQIVPYKYNKKTNSLIISKSDGLMEFDNNLKYLKDSYEEILNNNIEILQNIRIIRNKYQHKLHGVRFISASSGNYFLLKVKFEIENRDSEIVIKFEDIIKLVKGLNSLFTKIQKDALKFLDNQYDNDYYIDFKKFCFVYYDAMYEGPLLREYADMIEYWE